MQENQLKEINIYPNPTTEIINIESKNNTINRVEIYSMTGQVIKSIKGIISTIDVSHITQGNYFLKLYSGTNFVIEQFVKK